MGEQHIRKPHRQKRCQCLLEAIADAVFTCDSQGRVITGNPAFRALVEKAREATFVCPAEGMLPSELPHIVSRHNDEVLADGKTRSFEFVMSSPAGLRFFWITKGLCTGKCESKSPEVFCIVRDITELRRIEREIIDTGDHEKERLGHQLRENFCQHLVGISLLGNVLFEELSKAGIEQARFARQITTLVKEVVSEVRALEKGLSVAHLEQGDGLVEALRDLAEMVRLQNNVECVFRAPANKLTVAPETAMYLFRIAQEAVYSALHRSPVRQVLIRFTATRGALVLSVRDDGASFPKGVTVEAWARAEFPIMQHRSRVIGAKLDFKRFQRGGVEVVCSMPRYSRKRRTKGSNKAVIKQ